MIGGTKAMIARCIDKMRNDACGGCERHDACADLFRGLFGRMGSAPRRKERSRRPAAHSKMRPFESAGSPFLAFLGEVARAIETNARPRASAFRREVEALVEPMLEKGAVRIENVARALGCSRQTLYRRLKAEGVTFAILLDDLRRRLALRYVREQKMPVKEAAYRLGFSEPAAFSRAYKRWTGASPRGAQA